MRVLLIALLAVAALPAAADAATVSRTGGTLRYEAGKGERIYGRVFQTGSGAFVAQRDKKAHQRLTPGPGCKRSKAGELRCAGAGIERVEVSLARARTSTFWVLNVHVPVAAVGSSRANDMAVYRTSDFTYDGGPGPDDVAVRDSPDGHFTIRLGAGADDFSGQPEYWIGEGKSTATFDVDGGPGRDTMMGGAAADTLDGGPGDDTLDSVGGADTLIGGPGTDTAVLSSFRPYPNQDDDDGPISVTLDGLRNDGTAGQNALVGADIENATIGSTGPGTDDVLIGNDGPNVLTGPDTVRGLGGNDILVTNYSDDADNHTLLDGGDGDDRIGARSWDTASGSFASKPAAVICGAGSDVVFTNATPAPADCEHVNVGLHVRGATPIGRKGIVRARIGCDDPRGCVLGGLDLTLHGHHAGGRTARKPGIAIPFGERRTISAQLSPRVWRRHRSDRSLRVRLEPFPRLPLWRGYPALNTGAYPRTLTLRVRAMMAPVR